MITRRFFIQRAIMAAAVPALPRARKVARVPTGIAGTTRQPDYGRRMPGIGQQGTDEDPDAFSFSRFRFHQISNVGDQWDINTFCDEELLKFVRENTNIKLSARSWGERVVGVEDLQTAHADASQSRIGTHPFLFMTGEAEFRFSRIEREVLAEFFRRGGFLYSDDCVGGVYGDRFFRACLREMSQVMPDGEVKACPGITRCSIACTNCPRARRYARAPRTKATGFSTRTVSCAS